MVTSVKKTRSFLLVDDDSIYVRVVKMSMGIIDKNIVIHSCSNVEDALKYLEEIMQFPDVILVDLNMPIYDGYDFLEKYEKEFFGQNPNTKVFMLTSSIYQKDKQMAVNFKSLNGFKIKSNVQQNLQEILDEI
jgi:CheY-like chemotaxis protein